MMKKLFGIGLPIIALLGVIAMIAVAANGVSIPVLDTRGIIADAQRDTLYLAVLVMLIVVLPVFFLTFFIAIKYRETNKGAKYQPEWANNKYLEAIWWGIPLTIIVVLSVVTWNTSHTLDPFRALDSDKKPLQIQVVALQWKWLFIYPESGVASVGEFAMPVDTPVEFTITSDAPMNSFWIPQLGGQIYAMAGMSTKLHLSAREIGDYRGSSANLSGEGHASMTFTAKARSDKDFTSWVNMARESSTNLDSATYAQLRLPSQREGVGYYRLATTDLYDSILARYSDTHMMTGNKKTMLNEGDQ